MPMMPMFPQQQPVPRVSIEEQQAQARNAQLRAALAGKSGTSGRQRAQDARGGEAASPFGTTVQAQQVANQATGGIPDIPGMTASQGAIGQEISGMKSQALGGALKGALGGISGEGGGIFSGAGAGAMQALGMAQNKEQTNTQSQDSSGDLAGLTGMGMSAAQDVDISKKGFLGGLIKKAILSYFMGPAGAAIG